MWTAIVSLVLALGIAAAPLPQQRQLPSAATITSIQHQIDNTLDGATGTQYNQYGTYNPTGGFVNTYVPIAATLDSTVGEPNVLAIDILADRLCIASPGQGSLCNELLAYAYAWYVAQQKGRTYRQVAQALGPNNMASINTAINSLCLEDETPQFNGEAYGMCIQIGIDVDTLANSIIGENDGATFSEDNNNSNSLEYFGLQNLLPAPSPLGI